MPPKPSEVIRKLLQEGWVIESQKGSHVKLTKNGKLLIIARHSKEFKLGTWEAIRKRVEWN